MNYKKIALALNTPINFDLIQKTANYYANGKFFIEIYENGTCVFPAVSEDNSIGKGIDLLLKIALNPIDFIVKEMDDHNFVIQFSESVFSIVFENEFKKHHDEIAQQVADAVSDETLIGIPNAPPDHLLIGIYARTRLLEDINTPKLIRKIVPEQLE